MVPYDSAGHADLNLSDCRYRYVMHAGCVCGDDISGLGSLALIRRKTEAL